MNGVTPVVAAVAGTITFALLGAIVLACVLAWTGLAIAGAIDRRRAVPDGACDDDGTGLCWCRTEVGDDTLAMLAQPADTVIDDEIGAEVDRMIRGWQGDGRG